MKPLLCAKLLSVLEMVNLSELSGIQAQENPLLQQSQRTAETEIGNHNHKRNRYHFGRGGYA